MRPTDRLALPVMQCDPGCGECCGPVLCHEWEYQRVESYAKKHGLTPISQGSTCPWYQNGTCAVYPVRPFACRAFGHFQRLTCCRGYNTNVSRSEERRMNRVYHADTQVNITLGGRFLHSILSDDDWLDAVKALATAEAP